MFRDQPYMWKHTTGPNMRARNMKAGMQWQSSSVVASLQYVSARRRSIRGVWWQGGEAFEKYNDVLTYEQAGSGKHGVKSRNAAAVGLCGGFPGMLRSKGTKCPKMKKRFWILSPLPSTDRMCCEVPSVLNPFGHALHSTVEKNLKTAVCQ